MTNYTYSYILTEPILAIRHSELLMRRLSNKTRTFFYLASPTPSPLKKWRYGQQSVAKKRWLSSVPIWRAT